MESALPIGVFDSGLGGLTAVNEIRKILPNEDIIYLGDTARVPYGTRSRETILEYAEEDLGFLKSRGVKYVIAACGTVSSVMMSEGGFRDRLCNGVIEPSAAAACKITKNRRIGVIATGTSIKSGSYEKAIKKALPGAEVISKACPMFVPLVENGYIQRDCIPAVKIAEEYLLPLKDAGIDTLILGCTHYPLISGIISDILGEEVSLISSGAEAVRYAKKVLEENGLLNKKSSPGELRLYSTDSAELFEENACRFIDIKDVKVEQIRLEE